MKSSFWKDFLHVSLLFRILKFVKPNFMANYRVFFLKRITICIISLFFANFFPLTAQEVKSKVEDTIKHTKTERDSILIEQLMVELNELKLNEILKQEEFERQNKATFVADSISRAEQRRRIDSLRNILPGDPIVIEGDTLFKLYAKRGGHLPAQRVKMTEDKIMMLGKRLAFKRDSLYILDSDHVSDIMSGDNVIITITDNDGLWQNTTRNELAEQYLPIIENKIADLQAIYGLKERIKNTLQVILVIVVLITAIYLVVLMYRYFKRYIRRGLKNKFKPIIIKDYELLSPIKYARVLMFFSRLLKFILILFLLLISIPILFSIFPETDDLSRRFFSYITTPLSSYWNSFVEFLPDLIKIILLISIFSYVLK